MSRFSHGISITEYLLRLAEQVDNTLERLLPKPSPYSKTVNEAMHYSVCGAGKRLRAALVVEGAYVCGGERSKALPLAAAIEMIHAYSLVHDDLPCMDDDDMRRGKPANHKVFGEGMAVLAGDALLTHAFHILAELPDLAGVPPAVALQIIVEIAEAAGTYGMIGGQAADLLGEGAEPDPALLEYIHTRKTGALFRASVRSGALLAGARDDELDALTEFARHFGIAFQIVDDLLDVTGDAAKLGKRVGSDEKQGKLTFPRVYGIAGSQEMAAQHIAAANRALSVLGERADRLRELCTYVLTREA